MRYKSVNAFDNKSSKHDESMSSYERTQTIIGFLKWASKSHNSIELIEYIFKVKASEVTKIVQGEGYRKVFFIKYFFEKLADYFDQYIEEDDYNEFVKEYDKKNSAKKLSNHSQRRGA